MTKQEFNTEIAEEIRRQIADKTEIMLHSVSKNNGLVLDALTIMYPGTCAAPTMYLEPYYRDFLQGESIENLADRLLSDNGAYLLPEFTDPEELETFDKAEDRIRYRLVNYDMNREMLKNVPHIRFLDLAKIYCMIMEVDDGFASAIIRNSDLEDWNISLEELDRKAEKNMAEYEPARVEPLRELIRSISPGALRETEDEDIDPDTFGAALYVLSTKNRLFGASCLLYPGLMSDLASQFESGFFILPSSVHELLVLPDAGFFTRRDLECMVSEINTTQVERIDILSNHVYYYSRMSDSLTL